MALREERISGRIRFTIHVPTDVMISDALTKPGVFHQLMLLLTTGVARFTTTKKDVTAKRIRHLPAVYDEADLKMIEKFA